MWDQVRVRKKVKPLLPSIVCDDCKMETGDYYPDTGLCVPCHERYVRHGTRAMLDQKVVEGFQDQVGRKK